MPSHLGGRVVLENTQIYVPPFVLQRYTQYRLLSSDEFILARWLCEKAGQHGSAAFICFSFGSSNCEGRYLARRELVVVISALARTFDLAGWTP